jgi:hypothetical protein
MKLFSTLLLLVCISSVYGCATVTRGTSDVLVIESEPPGAEVEIQPANHHCKTPCSVKLKRKLEQIVTIRRESFEPVEVRVIPQVVGAGAAGMAGNVILGGLIGAAVDAGSGAMKDLKPNPVKVTMVASKPALTTEPVVPASTVPAAAPADTSVSTQAVSAGG